MADVPAASMKGSGSKNVFYINFTPKDPRMKDQLAAITANVDLNTQFIDHKATKMVQTKIDQGQLDPNDEISQGSYKTKVVDHLISGTPWISKYNLKNLVKNFTVEKSTFHETLVMTFAESLLPDTIVPQLEDIVTGMKNTINASGRSSLLFYIWITVFIDDEVRESWIARHRSIFIRVGDSLSSYIKSKDNSSGSDVNVDIEYSQEDAEINGDIFETAKKSIGEYLAGKNGEFTNRPINISY